MKTASSAFAQHLAAPDTRLATCWKIARRDGRVLGFTEHDRDLVIDLGDGDGAVAYAAATGLGRRSLRASLDFAADDLEVQGVLDSAALAAADIRAGRYDAAEVKIFLAVWDDLAAGPLKLLRGRLGRIVATEAGFTAELLGLSDRYATQEVVELAAPTCRADLFDARCRVQLAGAWQPLTAYAAARARDAGVGAYVKPSAFNDRWFRCVTPGVSGAAEPAWNTALGGTTDDGTVQWQAIRAREIEAVVAAVTDAREFALDYAGDAPDAFLTGGLLTVTGAGSPPPVNAGIGREATGWDLASKTVTLALPLPIAPQPGDAVALRAGCDKIHDGDCAQTFDNIENFRGEPFVPGNDLLFKTPGGG